MAVILTLEEFRLRHPEITTPDPVVQDYIDYVQTFVPALSECYPDPIVRSICYSLVAHLCSLTAGRRVSSHRAPNGASQTFDLGKEGNGLAATSYGRLIMQLDTCGIVTNEFDTSIFIGAIGGRNAPL